jgi:hypothetical protein
MAIAANKIKVKKEKDNNTNSKLPDNNILVDITTLTTGIKAVV